MKTILITGSVIQGGLALSLARGFQDNGWVVHHFDDQPTKTKNCLSIFSQKINRLFWKVQAKKIQNNLLERIREIKPDALLVLKGFYFDLNILQCIRKELPFAKLIHFNPDNTFNTWHFGNSNAWIRSTIPHYDIHLTWGKFLMPRLLNAGAKKVLYFPFGYDPDLHSLNIEYSIEDFRRYSCDVSFVGSWDEEREYWLSHLLDYDIKIWGNGWYRAADSIQAKWQKSEIIGKNFSRVCSLSKVSLNFIRRQNIPAHNMRTFEIPASGGFMLSTRAEEQSQLLVEDSEIACFSSPQELKEKLNFYLAQNEIRVAMARRSFDRVIASSSYSQRVLEIESMLV